MFMRNYPLVLVLLMVGMLALSACGESSVSDTSHDDTSHTDPSDADPTDTDPSDTDPSDTDPTDTDPTDTDPTDTDPTDTEPTDTDPTDTDPTDTDPADADPIGAELSIQGEYVDNYGADHEISNELWVSGSSMFAITYLSNEEQMLVAQNDSDNAWSADLWSRFDWTENEDGLWYCQTAYGAESEEAAMNTEAPDAADPAMGGCGSFSWSKLDEALSIRGEFVDNYGSDHTISQSTWVSGSSMFAITYLSNEDQMLVAQNDSDNAWSADLWSRFDWTENEDGLWYCQTAYGAESEEAAMNTEAPDAADPANGGCGSFSWSKVDEALSIRGEFVDNYGTDHMITQSTWVSGSSIFAITYLSNDDQMLVAQNDSGNAWSADLWSRFDWTENEDGLWYCQTAYGAESEEAAMNTEAADASDPANGGCSGFSWSKLEDTVD